MKDLGSDKSLEGVGMTVQGNKSVDMNRAEDQSGVGECNVKWRHCDQTPCTARVGKGGGSVSG